jgi:DNA-binding GntR family transcriptional regulator
MIEMWAALESMAARLATINASDEDILALRHMFDEFRNATPAEHIEEYSDANIAFHQAIIGLSGSHLMGKTIENLFIHVRAIRRMTISQSDRAARSMVDHMRIIEALEKRDTERAERLVRQHSLDLAAHVEKYCDFLN